jgi:hypothetical protein
MLAIMAHIRQIYPNFEIRLEHINESGVLRQVDRHLT